MNRPKADLRSRCLGEPIDFEDSHRFLVVWAGPLPEPLSHDTYDPKAFNWIETVDQIHAIYGFDFEQVEVVVEQISDWCRDSMRSRRIRTLFDFARFVKGRLVDPSEMHNPLRHAETLWMAQLASELLMPYGGFVDDYQWSDSYNEMALDPDDLALEWERVWSAVQFAEGENLLTKCFTEATAYARRFEPSPKYNQFLGLAWRLQEHQGQKAIMLPQERCAALLGCTRQVVSYLTRRALKDGYLELGELPHPHIKAAKYYFRPKRRRR